MEHDYKKASEDFTDCIFAFGDNGMTEDTIKAIQSALRIADRLQSFRTKYYGQNNYGTAYPVFWVIKKPGGGEESMFLFEEDAKNHLKANSYRYPDGSHIYCKHVWRAPMTQEFIELTMAAQMIKEVEDE